MWVDDTTSGSTYGLALCVYFHVTNGRDSFQLFVGVLDTYPVWYLLVLPSEIHAAANMTSLRAIDGGTSYHSRESFSLATEATRGERTPLVDWLRIPSPSVKSGENS